MRFLVFSVFLFVFGALRAENIALVNKVLPEGPVEYEMRVGKLDFVCTGADKASAHNSEAKVLQATVQFSAMPENLGFDPDKHVLVVVKTSSEWAGILNIETGELAVEVKRLADITSPNSAELKGLSSVFILDRVEGEYVRGTIHGKIVSHRVGTDFLRATYRCRGEGTLLLQPK